MVASLRARQTSEADQEEDRRARKRATDRRAQRDHRLRRKAYVKQLEESVKSLSEKQSPEERIAALLEEQKALREKCNEMTIQLDRVRTIVAKKPGPMDDGCEASKQIPSPSDSNTDNGQRSTSAAAEDFVVNGHSLSSMDPFYHYSTSNHKDIDSGIDDSLYGIDYTHADTMSQSRNICPDLNHVWDDQTCQLTTGLSNAHGSIGHQLSSVPMGTVLPITDDSSELPNLDLMQPEDAVMDIIALQHPSQSLIMSGSSCGSLDYFTFPKFSPPVGVADRKLMTYLQEARTEHMNGHFETSKPSLRSLLSDPPPDVLAFRLFHFISSYGAMPLHNMLATYWCQYLYLRWLVIGTRQAYEMMPDFMRPTKLQCTVPHRFFIGMIVWPGVRRSLIQDGSDPEAVGIAALQNLGTNWSSSGLHGILTGQDVLGIIQQQAETLSWWNVNPALFKKYPQFTEYHLQG